MSFEPPLYVEIVGFWRAAGPEAWFTRDQAFDDDIRARYEAVHFAAARGEFAGWTDNAEGSLALLLLTDQFPRNLFRGSAHAYATDGIARAAANQALKAGHDREVEAGLRIFFYLPFEHSEAPEHQARAVALFEAHARETGDEDSLKWAVLHQDIITQFGRFPHRNAALGRESTAAELAFLADGGFAG